MSGYFWSKCETTEDALALNGPFTSIEAAIGDAEATLIDGDEFDVVTQVERKLSSDFHSEPLFDDGTFEIAEDLVDAFNEIVRQSIDRACKLCQVKQVTCDTITHRRCRIVDGCAVFVG